MAGDNRLVSGPPDFAMARTVRKRSPVFPAALLDQAIIEILGQTSAPISAYDLADHLRDRGRNLPMMSIYRALDRLCSGKMIEKVQTLSAYRVKDVPKPILAICVKCGKTKSIAVPDIHDALLRTVADTAFYPNFMAIEVTGTCSDCAG